MLKTKEEPTGVGHYDKNQNNTTEQLVKGNQQPNVSKDARLDHFGQPKFSYPKNGLYGLL